jgi:hypothetical protein
MSLTLENERAQGRPGASSHPRSACIKGSTRQNHRWCRIIRPSLRNGFTAYFVLSPGTGLFCPRHSRGIVSHENLAPASGRQDHTPSPSASASLVLRRCRVHRIPPHVRDDAYAPLAEAGRRDEYTVSDFPKVKYFSRSIWTTQIGLISFRKLKFTRTRFSNDSSPPSRAACREIQLSRPTGRHGRREVRIVYVGPRLDLGRTHQSSLNDICYPQYTTFRIAPNDAM